MECWIARDKNGLYMYEKRPTFFIPFGEFGCMIGELYCKLPSQWFPEVTFEKSPYKVEIKLCSEIVSVAESPSKTFPRVNVFEVGSSYRR